MLIKDRLIEEAELWLKHQRTPRIWLRDDDAITHSYNLDMLFEFVNRFKATVALSVVPKPCDMSLVNCIRNCDLGCAWQHGWSHEDHGNFSEFPEDREVLISIRDIETGKSRMDDLFGRDGWIPIFVPPWNNIARNLKLLLPSLGFCGVSSDSESIPVPACKEVNIDIDVLDWSTSKVRFSENCLVRLLHAMVLRRTSDRFDQPIGILTHHRRHDSEVWGELEMFFDFIVSQLKADFIDVKTLLKSTA